MRAETTEPAASDRCGSHAQMAGDVSIAPATVAKAIAQRYEERYEMRLPAMVVGICECILESGKKGTVKTRTVRAIKSPFQQFCVAEIRDVRTETRAQEPGSQPRRLRKHQSICYIYQRLRSKISSACFRSTITRTRAIFIEAEPWQVKFRLKIATGWICWSSTI